MKLIFICGSLEPGRDGVGDYTRRLAGELMRQGHQVANIALYDKHITKDFASDQSIKGINIPVLRIPYTWSSNARLIKAKEFIDYFQPEWLSLQFVPFSFHNKGLIFGLSKLLLKIGKGRDWHIMFHELWVGMEKASSIKLVLWGGLQRLLIKSLISNLKPKVVHTQTKLYQDYLSKLNIAVEILPLFSNIPVFHKKIAINNNSTNKVKTISLIIFGNIHSGAPIEDFSEEVSNYAKEHEIQFVLKFLGRCGVEQRHWISTWRSAGLEVEILGELPAELISKIFSGASIGIATTPLAILEKSGSVAAMLEHGLTVVSVSRPWIPRGKYKIEQPQGVIEYRKGNFPTCIEDKGLVNDNKLFFVSNQLINNLLATIYH